MVAIGCTWLLSSVFPLISSFLILLISFSFINLGLVALFSSLSLSSSPQPLSTTSSSTPHVQSCTAPTPNFPLLFIFHNPHYSLHLDPVWLGWTAGGSPHYLVVVWDISASGTETETTHSLCCGFGRKISVKLLLVAALFAVPSD